MLSANRIEEVIKNCQALIQQKSYSGQEGEVVNAIKTMMQHYQFDDIHVDKYGNIVGGIVGNQPGKTLVLDGHIDTVPVNEEKWSRNPYGGDIEDGKIYGRGTTDMKGAVAAMISAVGFFGQDNQRNFAGKIYVACIVHEECFEGIAARLVSERYKPDYVIIGEASELNLKIGQRGRAEIVVETFGKPAHSANPQAGINAVYKMAQLIDKIRTITPPTHPVLGPGILELTDIKSSPYPGASVVPDYCRATYDRRLLVGETKESVIAPLENALAELIAQDPSLRPECPTRWVRSLAIPAPRLRESVFSQAGCSTSPTNSCRQRWRAFARLALIQPLRSTHFVPTAATMRAKRESKPSALVLHEKTWHTPLMSISRSSN